MHKATTLPDKLQQATDSLLKVAATKGREVATRPKSHKDDFLDQREIELNTEVYNDYKSFINRERQK